MLCFVSVSLMRENLRGLRENLEHKIRPPENAGAHYMPDIRPNQTFITDQDPELFDILNLEERKRKNREKKLAKKDPITPILDLMKQDARPLYFVSN